ncbi:MAG TPA: LytR C-terminal domain-containing protein [Gemmatimonadaceae bacterium]|jgi:hypothetical protein
MTNTRIIIIVLIGCALMGGAMAVSARRVRAARAAATIPPELRAPDSVRIRVQVLNGTKTRGLARRATMFLRDRGFDVVENGTVNDARDSTLVLDLSGHPEWAQRIAKIIGHATVESRPDSSRYLDISVVLGASWRPPAQPFYP